MIKTNFTAKVYQVVANIAFGQVMTYGQVATAAGRPKAARAVGRIMAANTDPKIPCHRVVAAGGRLGGYNRGPAAKRRRLQAEGRFDF